MLLIRLDISLIAGFFRSIQKWDVHSLSLRGKDIQHHDKKLEDIRSACPSVPYPNIDSSYLAAAVAIFDGAPPIPEEKLLFGDSINS